MNLLTRAHRLVAAGLLLAAALAARAETAAVAAWKSADFHVKVEGTSTLHAWSVESRTATGELRRTAADRGAGSLQIPATSLSGGPRGLNDRMYAALQTRAHPTIAFEVPELPLPAAAPAPDAPSTWSIPGRLTIAGKTRDFTIPCRVTAPTAERLTFEATVTLKMTDFGVTPPSFMGVVKTGDTVTVHVTWTLAAVVAAVAD